MTAVALPATTRVTCQRPFFAGESGYAETLMIVEGCEKPAAGLLVHECLEVRRLKDDGGVIAIADAAREPVTQVAAALLDARRLRARARRPHLPRALRGADEADALRRAHHRPAHRREDRMIALIAVVVIASAELLRQWWTRALAPREEGRS